MKTTQLFTHRLLLRPLENADAGEIFELNSDEAVLKYTGDSSFPSRSSAGEFIKAHIRGQALGFGRYAVVLRESGFFLGWCGLKQHEDFVDLGFRFHRKFWGHGFATESSNAMLKHGFRTLGLREIVGRTASANTASVKVLEKIGMRFSHTEECHGIPDAKIYKITNWEHQDLLNG